ncbi:MAG: DUF3471 domain-containing protein [Undibacterium sp.]|nr:DUF3471 domain-containing protein [Undibacterium sp.]
MYKILTPFLALCLLVSGYPDHAYAITQAAEVQEAATTATQFKIFEGNYELQAGFIINIFQKDNKFFAQATGQPSFEIFSESQYAFFAKVAPIKLRFVLDENGATSHMIFQQAGHEMRAARVQ